MSNEPPFICPGCGTKYDTAEAAARCYGIEPPIDSPGDDGFQAIWWPVDMTTAEMVTWCRRKRMTMQEIADRCGVSRRAVTAWTSGTEASYPHKSKLWAIAKGTRRHA